MTQWSLKIERDSEWFTVMRRKFSGEITIKGTDFDTLIATEGDVKQYAIVIHRECSGVYTEFWKGFFSYFDFKVDLDRCYLSFEPLVWDKYSPVYDQMEIDRNVLAASAGESITMDAYTYGHEDLHYSFVIDVPTPIVYGSWYDYPGLPAPSPNEYYLYSSASTFLQMVPDGSGGWWFQYSVSQIFRRDMGTTNSNAPGGGPSADPDWVLANEVSPGVWKWVRPYLDSAYTTYSWVTSGKDYTETLITPVPATPETFNGCITLKSILEYFAALFSLTYTSDFFNDDPCPMGGPTLELTMVQQISNMRDTADVATKGMMKLKSLLTWIRDTFNAYWYVDSGGDFRIEHRRYFDNGLSYTYTHVIELDIHAIYPVQTLKLNRYQWSKPDLFRFEKIEFPFSTSHDWVEAKIEYPQLSVLNYDTKTLLLEWGTDLIAMVDGKDELPKQGWVLLNVNWVSIGGGVFIKKVINTLGAITGVAMQNARFSSGNLLRDLWTWGKTLPTGNVNSMATTFDSVEKLRKQVELSIPQCCEDWDYEGLYRTELGDGWIESGGYEAKMGNLKINLMYE